MRDTVRPGETGVFFHERTVDSLADAVRRFERQASELKPERCRAQAEHFTRERFQRAFTDMIERAWRDWHDGGRVAS